MKRVHYCTLVPLFFLAACGGSGSNDNGGGNNQPPPTGVAITASNGAQASQVAYEAALNSGEVASFAGDTGLTADSGGGFAAPTIEQRTANKLVQLLALTPFGPLTLNCAMSGSLTVSGDLATVGTLTAQDIIIADYDNCDDGLGEVIDGTLNSEIDAFTGDIFTGIYDMTMSMDLDMFTVTAGTDVLEADGDGIATLNTLQNPYVEASISGDEMTTIVNGSTETLTTYASAQTLNAGLVPAPYTLTASGTVDSAQLSGAVTYSTPVMFEGFDVDYPNTGELLVVGDSGSARLTALDNVNVRVEIFDNMTGTGTPTSTLDTTWAELAAL